MAKILYLKEYRNKISEKKAFGPWEKRFKEVYSIDSLLSDISNKTLYYLAFPGKESTNAFYELILGVLDFGEVSTFYSLNKITQLRIIDIHLFTLDQFRFEMMFRLRWINVFPIRDIPIINIVTTYEVLKSKKMSSSLMLTDFHPEYDDFMQLCEREKEAFIRRLIPTALEQFKKKIL